MGNGTPPKHCLVVTMPPPSNDDMNDDNEFLIELGVLASGDTYLGDTRRLEVNHPNHVELYSDDAIVVLKTISKKEESDSPILKGSVHIVTPLAEIWLPWEGLSRCLNGGAETTLYIPVDHREGPPQSRSQANSAIQGLLRQPRGHHVTIKIREVQLPKEEANPSVQQVSRSQPEYNGRVPPVAGMDTSSKLSSSGQRTWEPRAYDSELSIRHKDRPSNPVVSPDMRYRNTQSYQNSYERDLPPFQNLPRFGSAPRKRSVAVAVETMTPQKLPIQNMQRPVSPLMSRDFRSVSPYPGQTMTSLHPYGQPGMPYQGIPQSGVLSRGMQQPGMYQPSMYQPGIYQPGSVAMYQPGTYPSMQGPMANGYPYPMTATVPIMSQTIASSQGSMSLPPPMTSGSVPINAFAQPQGGAYMPPKTVGSISTPMAYEDNRWSGG